MGYTTDFSGEFQLDRPLTQAHSDYLAKFSETRRMKRNEFLTANRPDPLRKAVGLPVGRDGCYFVNEEGYAGQGNDMFGGGGRFSDIVDYNGPPHGQPGLWCHWVPTSDGDGIRWNGGEKFYNYVEWIEYICNHFLAPWGIKLNGSVTWQGEEMSDRGVLVAKDNVITTKSFVLESDDDEDEEDSDPEKTYICVEDGAKKFWKVSRTENCVSIHFGRLGTKGQNQVKKFASSDEAKAYLHEKTSEKIGKGYLSV